MTTTPDGRFNVALTLESGYRFTADFGQADVAPLVVDEASPLGSGQGPNPARLLATAVGQCLGSSLLFCFRKSRIAVRALRVSVSGAYARNERGRLRIADLRVRLTPDVAPDDEPRIGRCLELFEDFCIVTESVRHGIAVDVAVETP